MNIFPPWRPSNEKTEPKCSDCVPEVADYRYDRILFRWQSTELNEHVVRYEFRYCVEQMGYLTRRHWIYREVPKHPKFVRPARFLLTPLTHLLGYYFPEKETRDESNPESPSSKKTIEHWETSLSPQTRYTVEFRGITNSGLELKWSPPATVQTGPSGPEITKLKSVEQGLRYVIVAWLVNSTEHDEAWTGFEFELKQGREVRKLRVSEQDTVVFWNDASVFVSILDFLEPAREYSLRIRSSTSVGYGNWTDLIQFRTDERAPKVRDCRVDECRSTSCSVEVEWNEKQLPSDEYFEESKDSEKLNNPERDAEDANENSNGNDQIEDDTKEEEEDLKGVDGNKLRELNFEEKEPANEKRKETKKKSLLDILPSQVLNDLRTNETNPVALRLRYGVRGYFAVQWEETEIPLQSFFPKFKTTLENLIPDSVYQLEASLKTLSDVSNPFDGVTFQTLETAPKLDEPKLKKITRSTVVLEIEEKYSINPVLSYSVQFATKKSRQWQELEVSTERHLISKSVDEYRTPEERGNLSERKATKSSLRILDDPSLTIELADLLPSTEYLIRVAARTEFGVGVFSPPAEAFTRPAAPRLFDAVKIFSTNETLSLCYEIEDFEDEITEFRVRYYEIGLVRHGQWRVITNPNHEYSGKQVRLRLDNLEGDKNYAVEASACTKYGPGGWSKTEKFQTFRSAPECFRPRLLEATSRELFLIWKTDETKNDAEIESFEFTGLQHVCIRSEALELANKLERTYELLRNKKKNFYYATVVTNLQPETQYPIQIRCLTSSGSGQFSRIEDDEELDSESEEVFVSTSYDIQTLPEAPKMTSFFVKETTNDSIVFSFQHLNLDLQRKQRSLVRQTRKRFEFPLQNIEDLQVRGFEFRIAELNFLRYSWHDTLYIPLDSCLRDSGYEYEVKNLNDEREYTAEIASRTSLGISPNLRLESTAQTASQVSPPEDLEIVYSTESSITVSFFFHEKRHYSIFEIRLRRRSGLGQTLKSDWFSALRLSRNSNDCVVSEKDRYVVSIPSLDSDTFYEVQIRAVGEQKRAVTRWSKVSSLMKTSPSESVAEIVSPRSASASRIKIVRPPEVKEKQSVELPDLEYKLEQVLNFTFICVRTGVKLASHQIPTIEEEALEILGVEPNPELAVQEMLRRQKSEEPEKTKVYTRVLVEFLVSRVPVAGASALFLKELWQRLRSIGIIAKLYGHDLDDPETHVLIFSCLIPTSSDNGCSSQAQEFVPNSSTVLKSVAMVFAREAFIRATGVRTMRMAFDGVASVLTSDKKKKEEEEIPGCESMACSVFRPIPRKDQPPALLLYLVLYLSPAFLSGAKFIYTKVVPVFDREVRTNLGVLIFSFFLLLSTSFWSFSFVRRNSSLSTAPATLVFGLQAILPPISTVFGVLDVSKGIKSGIYFYSLLGVYTLTNTGFRYFLNWRESQELDGRVSPQLELFEETCTKIRGVIWRLILFVFSFEIVLLLPFQYATGIPCDSVRFFSSSGDNTSYDYVLSPLLSLQTIQFGCGFLAVKAQEQLLEVIQKRTVVLRLLGARKTIIGAVALLFSGVSTVSKVSSVVSFLKNISPPPLICLLILVIRKVGILACFFCPIIWVLYTEFLLPSLWEKHYVHTSVAIPALVSSFISAILTFVAIDEWNERRKFLQGDYRVILLLPHQSAQAREKAIQTVTGVISKGTKLGTQVATEWMAARVARGIFGYFKS